MYIIVLFILGLVVLVLAVCLFLLELRVTLHILYVYTYWANKAD